jgi:exodeoxyribonuclease-3
MKIKIVSWNINSIRIRLDLLRKLMIESQADIICLQETKVEDCLFPINKISNFANQLGYQYILFKGEKSYNGVAIISKISFDIVNINKDICKFSHKRHIAIAIATNIGKINLHNFYIPAGGDIADPVINDKFAHKLDFIDNMINFFSGKKNQKESIIILGDFNIAPLINDVWSHKQLLNIVSHTAIEVEKLNKLLQTLDFIDTHRFFVDESCKLYSWWSYRAIDPFKSNRGRRLDHIWCTPNLTNYLVEYQFFNNYRILDKTSDHIPISTTFCISAVP